MVEVGRVARPHGTRGATRVLLHNPDSDMLLAAPAIMVAVGAAPPVSQRILAAYRAGKGGLVIELAGCTTVEGAEALRGARLCVARAELEPPDDGEFYACDLVGCRVEVAGEPLGTVERVVFYPTCDALLVARPDGGRLEVPLLDAYVERVDIATRVVSLRTAEGLTAP